MKTISASAVAEFLECLKAIGRRNSLRDPLAGLIAEKGLGPAQVHALMWLRDDGPLTMGVLAQRCGVTEKTITGIVDRMERDGHVTRERSSEDRRVVQVVLAETGRALSEELHRGVTRNMTAFLSILEPQDRKDLFRILKNLVPKLEALSAAQADAAADDT